MKLKQQLKESIKNIEEGHYIPLYNEGTPKTTFWSDFSIADVYGANGIKDTFNRAFSEWKDNYIYLTELVIVLNHKIWQWNEKDQNIARLYNDLWSKADTYALDNLKGSEKDYFLRETD